jgi:hypothetical protein
MVAKSLTAAILASIGIARLDRFRQPGQPGNQASLRTLLNVRSINIAEIALAFNRGLRS